jgi:plasmid stabilization system protein ParE
MSRRAEMDLAEITNFIALDNPARAFEFEEALLEHAHRIGCAPLACFLPPTPNWDNGHRGVEDVLAGTRDCVHMTDSAEGDIWIVRYTGSAPN